MVSISSLFSSIIEFLSHYVLDIIYFLFIIGGVIFIMHSIDGPENIQGYQK